MYLWKVLREGFGGCMRILLQDRKVSGGINCQEVYLYSLNIADNYSLYDLWKVWTVISGLKLQDWDTIQLLNWFGCYIMPEFLIG